MDADLLLTDFGVDNYHCPAENCDRNGARF
jgi:hypothetical protein